MNTESCTIDKKNGRFDPVFNRVFTFVTAFSWLLQSSEPQRSPLFYCPNHRPAAINNGIETLFHEAFPLGCALLLFFLNFSYHFSSFVPPAQSVDSAAAAAAAAASRALTPRRPSIGVTRRQSNLITAASRDARRMHISSDTRAGVTAHETPYESAAAAATARARGIFLLVPGVLSFHIIQLEGGAEFGTRLPDWFLHFFYLRLSFGATNDVSSLQDDWLKALNQGPKVDRGTTNVAMGEDLVGATASCRSKFPAKECS